MSQSVTTQNFFSALNPYIVELTANPAMVKYILPKGFIMDMRLIQKQIKSGEIIDGKFETGSDVPSYITLYFSELPSYIINV